MLREGWEGERGTEKRRRSDEPLPPT
jgi:hypothetical protein